MSNPLGYNSYDEHASTNEVFEKYTTYPRSFSLSPAQRDAILMGQFEKIRIGNAHTGELLWEAGFSVFHAAVLNARLVVRENVAFYVVKF